MNPARWKIRDEQVAGDDVGECDYATRTIRIDPAKQKNERDRLDTLAHELTHACQPDLNEDAVCRVAGFLTAHLWRQGYRRG